MFKTFSWFKKFRRVQQFSPEQLILNRAKTLYPKATSLNLLQLEHDDSIPDKVWGWVNVDNSPHLISINK